ncbi:MAG: phosphopantetheine-binding protein [Woeseiaceae bacterium]|nr:phosphopantetheine-binding protein [Woeseiaceae bacterium]
MDLSKHISDFIGTTILPGTPEEKILASESLFDDGIIDSLGLQQLIIHLEEEFGIFIEEEHLIPENFETVSGVSTLVESLAEAH